MFEVFVLALALVIISAYSLPRGKKGFAWVSYDLINRVRLDNHKTFIQEAYVAVDKRSSDIPLIDKNDVLCINIT